jgi:hypothetical protein
MEGFLRSMLYQILVQIPELATIAFPDQGDQSALDDSTQRSTYREWKPSNLSDAFRRLTNHKNMPARICIFVDGLDEYEGDHVELIELLYHMAKSPDIKLCVSSRPWNIFEDAFHYRAQHFYLQHFTKTDIANYTRNMLESNEDTARLIATQSNGWDAVEEITQKAEGVFLWVTLVVPSLVEGVGQGDSIEDLRRRLNAVPYDLHNLYTKILDSVDQFYRPRMVKYIKVAVQARKPLPLLSYYFMDEPVQFNVTPLNGVDTLALTPRSLTETQNIERLMSRRLNSSLRGLLEVRVDPSKTGPLSTTVDFLHRTVRDFLQSHPAQIILERGAPDFEASRAIFHANIQLIQLHLLRPYKQETSMALAEIVADTVSYAESRDSEMSYQADKVQLLNALRHGTQGVIEGSSRDGIWATFFSEAERWAATESPMPGRDEGNHLLAMLDQLASPTLATISSKGYPAVAPEILTGPRVIEIDENDEEVPIIESPKGNAEGTTQQTPEGIEKINIKTPLGDPVDPQRFNVAGKIDVSEDWFESTSSTNPGYAESLLSEVTSKTSATSYSADYIKPAREVLVEFLLEDTELYSLLTTAAGDLQIGIDKLARNFRRLLNIYSRDLLDAASNPLQKEAAKFVHTTSTYVSHAVRVRLDSFQEYVEEPKQKAITEERLNRFLEQLQKQGSFERDTPFTLGREEDAQSNSTGSELDDAHTIEDEYDEEAINKALAEVKHFLETGLPIENLRNGLRKFVSPHTMKEGQFQDTFPQRDSKFQAAREEKSSISTTPLSTRTP